MTMTSKRPATIEAYIEAAPRAGHAHLRTLYAILQELAPEAQEAMKWNTPFFIEPRFLFAFSAHKAHLTFVVMEAGLAPFQKELEGYKTTKGGLQIRYADPFPEKLVRKLAKRRIKDVRARSDDAFW